MHSNEFLHGQVPKQMHFRIIVLFSYVCTSPSLVTARQTASWGWSGRGDERRIEKKKKSNGGGGVDGRWFPWATNLFIRGPE